MEAFQLKLQRMKNYKQQLQYLLQKPIASPQFRQIFLECDQYQMIVQVLIEAKSDKISVVKEQLKLFGLLAECANENLSPQLQMIFTHLLKRIKDFESMSCVCTQVPEIIGKIVKHCCFDGDVLNSILKPLMNHLNQNAQHALCLTRVVQFLSYEILEQNALFLFRKFISLLNQQHGKVEILEGMAAIILSVEEQSDIFADEIIPHLQQLLSNQQWQVKKMALDILYSLVVFQKDKIQDHSYFKELMYELKSNKIKQVRDSANLILDVLQQNNQMQSNNSQQQLIQPQLDKQVTSVERQTNYGGQIKSQSQPQLLINTTNKQSHLNNAIPQQPQTPSQQQMNRLSQTPAQTNKANADDKLQLAIEAIQLLSGILKAKGMCDPGETQQIDSILNRLNERDSYNQPTIKFFQFNDAETFISREAAEILREFKEKQRQDYLR
ncbi:unnamed protein product (macronuclear) [Paramecium tetraurelia]|uniref:TORTIFOLIA1/SINE1-2 N-terminal domain-containing protein n=1 Tax=Paramecium tetraurelia TaxID=5888 RepID=A0E1U5_PARTE|nr:uncharacterized protein GSPATT00022433001 [Paramecium tetraurelia]CAK89262.1 unnamed protein product [Paramecium tetraurelia]|eukprot:XP_001456659.1 hypothetical protein (macronuclear) [Paramecium tetraurelia strain d4-2]